MCTIILLTFGSTDLCRICCEAKDGHLIFKCPMRLLKLKLNGYNIGTFVFCIFYSLNLGCLNNIIVNKSFLKCA